MAAHTAWFNDSRWHRYVTKLRHYQVTCRLTAKDRDQLWDPKLGSRVWAAFTFLLVIYSDDMSRWNRCRVISRFK